MKKMTQWLALTSITALCLTGTVFAQDQGGPGRRGGGNGGGGGFGGGGGGFGGGDPAEMRAQMEQRMMENTRTSLEITSDTEWAAVEPLVKKVNDLRMQQLAAGGGRGGMGGGRGGNRGGGQGGGGAGRGGFGAEPAPEQTALTEAVEGNASKEDLKSKMAAYRKARDQKAAELKTAQDNLKKVLTTKQEATALQMGLVN